MVSALQGETTMIALPAFRRAAAAALFTLSLAGLAEPGAAQTAPKDALGALNDTFRASYRELRDWRTGSLDPIIIVQFDQLHLVRNGKVTTETFTPPVYHDYKAISHIPLALYMKLARHVGRPFDKAMLEWLTMYLKQIQAAAASLEGRPGWTAETLRLHKQIAMASEKFIEKIGGAEEVSDQGLTDYTRAMRPLVLASADAAAKVQLEGLHALVTKWRGELGARWTHVDVVVLGPKQPRQGNLQYAYFKRAMGPGAEGRRLWYAEGIFDKDGGLNLLGTILIDRGASIAFFADPVRLERDLLGDAAQRHINRIFLRR
jgi:hypothetical protein